jgi:hypothetical protein
LKKHGNYVCADDKKMILDGNASDDEVDHDVVPRSETVVGVLHVETIADLMASIHTIAWDHHMLNLLKPSPKHGLPKCALLARLEFDTGVNEQSFIGTEGPLKNLQTLKGVLKQLSVSRGSRGATMPMKGSWTEFGPYTKPELGDDGKIWVGHQYLEGHPKRRLPERQQQLIGSIDNVYIERPWSDMNALLMEKGTDYRYKLSNLFPELDQCDPFENYMRSLPGSADRKRKKPESLENEPVSEQMHIANAVQVPQTSAQLALLAIKEVPKPVFSVVSKAGIAALFAPKASKRSIDEVDTGITSDATAAAVDLPACGPAHLYDENVDKGIGKDDGQPLAKKQMDVKRVYNEGGNKLPGPKHI